MMYISHRGYINGPDDNLENNPDHISKLLEKNIHVEIDVRYHMGNFYLGHDKPKFKINRQFLTHHNLWCHAKDHMSLEAIKNINCHYFWHQEDDYTITSEGYIWVYPGRPLIQNSICVLPKKDQDFSICSGVCTDNIAKFIKV